MRYVMVMSACAALGVASAALAGPTLQFDVNAIGFQVGNADGGGSPFGGLTHTGSINFASQLGITELQGIYAQSAEFGPWLDQGFSGSLASFSGVVSLENGVVSGGHVTLSVNGGADSYTCSVVPDIGKVRSYIGGGYTVQGLTFAGAFSDGMFGNVDVSQWFAGNGALFGSFIEFNFNPDQLTGAGFADMDIFVDVIPLPPAAWAGLVTLAGIGITRWTRRARV